jgi:hypothetical protein
MTQAPAAPNATGFGVNFYADNAGLPGPRTPHDGLLAAAFLLLFGIRRRGGRPV